ncbi:hypothetical protein ILYODFUR_037200, partial [Ilyodon furcidens]
LAVLTSDPAAVMDLDQDSGIPAVVLHQTAAPSPHCRTEDEEEYLNQEKHGGHREQNTKGEMLKTG